MRKIILVAAIAMMLVIVTFVGCGQSQSKTSDTTPTVTAPAYAQPITEAMLKALSTGDYQSYRLYMSKNMTLMTTEDVFKVFYDFYSTRLGDYVSMKFSDVKVEGDKTTVVYKAKYSLEDDVIVTVVFTSNSGKPLVDDLYLNSPKLWEH